MASARDPLSFATFEDYLDAQLSDADRAYLDSVDIQRALVELGEPAQPLAAHRARPSDELFRALFEPKGVLIAGASSHPGARNAPNASR